MKLGILALCYINATGFHDNGGRIGPFNVSDFWSLPLVIEIGETIFCPALVIQAGLKFGAFDIVFFATVALYYA